MTTRAKTAILPWLMAAVVVLAALSACAPIFYLSGYPAAQDGTFVAPRVFEVRCGIENARPTVLPNHEVIVTTDEGWAILPLHDCPPQARSRYCYTFPPCKRA